MSDGMSDAKYYGPSLSKHGTPIISKDGTPIVMWCKCGHKQGGHTASGACLECRAIEGMEQPCNWFDAR